MGLGVVVVDDAADLRMLLVRALDRDGRLEVRADVGDGRAGVDAVVAHRPDVVLMDVAMPVLDGLAATREIKSSFPDLPVVVLTGYADDRVEEEAMQAGADAFVGKTTPLGDVVELLVKLASRD